MAKRKKITMLVTVSVPADMTAADARREVRTLVTHQCNWKADSDDVKAIRVGTAPSFRNPLVTRSRRYDQ